MTHTRRAGQFGHWADLARRTYNGGGWGVGVDFCARTQGLLPMSRRLSSAASSDGCGVAALAIQQERRQLLQRHLRLFEYPRIAGYPPELPRI
ncbi:hypothetical protein NDU88_006415 [Pleurodeles waltl]|uniref:Uncharacterized protein n=1 Tax=Pleurodeles waltl TaxID=8319 RepID=A0AAV7NZ96_PLEWA|nr:hypothetical protein NDU88_006415 [Pleurodeles waltl]